MLLYGTFESSKKLFEALGHLINLFNLQQIPSPENKNVLNLVHFVWPATRLTLAICWNGMNSCCSPDLVLLMIIWLSTLSRRSGQKDFDPSSSLPLKIKINSMMKYDCVTDLGRIHLVHLRIHKYFTDDSSVNFHDKIFLYFLKKCGKKWRKTLSWKFTDDALQK